MPSARPSLLPSFTSRLRKTSTPRGPTDAEVAEAVVASEAPVEADPRAPPEVADSSS